MRPFLCPMTAQAPHISHTCCIFSSTDFQCMCKASIMYISTIKLTAPKSSSSLHTSKHCFKMHINLPQNGCNDSTCKHVWEGTKNGALWDNSPISLAQAREPSQHKALKTHLQKDDEFCRDFPIFASLYPVEYLNWQRQAIWKIQLHCHIKLWTKVWNISLYWRFTDDY